MLTDVKAGEVLTVLAFAGTGKTTCLRAYAQARPYLSILYLTVSGGYKRRGDLECHEVRRNFGFSGLASVYFFAFVGEFSWYSQFMAR